MTRSRLARLGDRLLWFRHTYPFQLAHGPLCDRHRGNVVRFGHVHVCRSCLALYGTLALGLPIVLWWAPESTLLTRVMLTLAALVAVTSWPPLYRRLPRFVRDLARAGAGLWAALVLGAFFSGYWVLAGWGAAGIVLLFFVYGRWRLRYRARACDGCPELEAEGVCSGYARQAERLGAYEDAMLARLTPGIARELESRDRGQKCAREAAP